MTASTSTIKFKPHYSGPLSRKFWSQVNSVKGSAWGPMYTLGCALQNLEGQVLRELAELPKGKNREAAMRRWCDKRSFSIIVEELGGKNNKNRETRRYGPQGSCRKS